MSCLSPELSQQCLSACSTTFDGCLIKCNDDVSCISTCNRQYSSCIDVCPCGDGCLDGCPCDEPNTWCCRAEPENAFQYEACVIRSKQHLGQCLDICASFDGACHQNCTDQYNSSIDNCPCMDQCLEGCPCDGFDCNELKSPVDVIIYALDSVTWDDREFLVNWNVTEPGMPLSITSSGHFQQGVDDETSKRYRCAFQLNNKFHLVGGQGQSDKAHYVLANDQLEHKTDLTFNFYDGLCYGNSADGLALLCAPDKYEDYKSCWSYNEEQDEFFNAPSTMFNHRLGGLTFFIDQFVVVAGWEASGRVEMLDDENWSLLTASNELLNNYKNFSPVVLDNALFLFGDYNRNGNVFKFTHETGWIVHPQKFNSYGQTSIGFGSQVFHLGTSDGTEQPIEYWELQPTGEFKIVTSDFKFDNWYVPYLWISEFI